MITAIVLAAGQSSRMGTPKMALKWGNSTVIARVIENLLTGGLQNIIVITGGAQEIVEKALDNYKVRFVHNSNYSASEMLDSIQLGLSSIRQDQEAALITLGDQPQIEVAVIKKIVQSFKDSRNKIIVPSYDMRRGHPWLIEKSLWVELLKIRSPQSTRSFFAIKSECISYLEVNTSSIIQDLDTPEDYQKYTKELTSHK